MKMASVQLTLLAMVLVGAAGSLRRTHAGAGKVGVAITDEGALAVVGRAAAASNRSAAVVAGGG